MVLIWPNSSLEFLFFEYLLYCSNRPMAGVSRFYHLGHPYIPFSCPVCRKQLLIPIKRPKRYFSPITIIFSAGKLLWSISTHGTFTILTLYLLNFNSYRTGRYFRVTYKGRSRIIRRVSRRFKVRVGYRRWSYIAQRRGRFVLRIWGRYRTFRLTGGRITVRYGRRWRIIRRKPRNRRRLRRWRRRRRRRRRRRVRRQRRRYRRRRRRIRQRNILTFRYRRRWIRVFRRGRFLRCRIRGRWRIVR